MWDAKTINNSWILLVTAVLASCAMALSVLPPFDQRHTLALLVADGTSLDLTRIWQQTALEEGIKLDIVTASQFLRARKTDQRAYAGIVVADTTHRRASDYLTDTLREYVQSGGKLMLTFDALTHDLNGAYPESTARLSDLTGVDYAMYEQFGKDVITARPILTTINTMQRIGVPPGRTETLEPIAFRGQLFDQWMTTYRYQELQYPIFQTGTVSANTEVLMLTPERQVVAAERHVGAGRVLFVNLPLSLLKNSTDGLLMHDFLRYFSDEFVELPRLLSTPNGIGGLILNIHVDNGAAIKSLTTLQQMGIFEQGPYSIHFTAGPDVNQFGDGLGMDVSHNLLTQQWIRYLQARGHAIGNHGGWIHNYFGTHINEDNRSSYEKFLTLNNDALKKIVGHDITEYSAPIGNHPLWVTDWLANHDGLTYYTTANLGMGPTRTFRNNVMIDTKLWSIPITPFGRIASFEEAMFARQRAEPMTDWLLALANFVSTNRTIRQIYCHPIGVPYFADSMQSLLATTKALAEQHHFQWRTMSETARFMSRRESTVWHLISRPNELELDASHPVSLNEMSWRVPESLCSDPRITAGKGSIVKDQHNWLLTAGDVRKLTVRCVGTIAPPDTTAMLQH